MKLVLSILTQHFIVSHTAYEETSLFLISTAAKTSKLFVFPLKIHKGQKQTERTCVNMSDKGIFNGWISLHAVC